MMKIIYCWGHTRKNIPLIEQSIKEWVTLGYEVTSINNREELGIGQYNSTDVDKWYARKDVKLLRHYEKIKQLSESHDVLIVEHGNLYHPEFLKTLRNIYTVFICNDDPEGSRYLSEPNVHAFDHSFTATVYFDHTKKAVDKYKEWGAKRADWLPMGVWSGQYDPKLTENDIYDQDRDIDLIFVGTAHLKLGRIAALKHAFPQMTIYGRAWGKWGWRALATNDGKLQALRSGLWRVKELPVEGLAPIYKRSKIGVNIHESFGPINRRLYELPANGVMQVCDCPQGLNDVFDVGKEVIGYSSIKEAIELIRYYLDHDDERKQIAQAGFRRVMRDYKRVTVLDRAMKKIKRGMIDKGITHFKDGKPIQVE